MNPSASGWINKFGQIVNTSHESYANFVELYNALRKTGFVYGINTQVPPFIATQHTLSEDEKAKINLVVGLYSVFNLENPKTPFDAFLEAIFAFYQDLGIQQISFLHKILTGKKTSDQLEKLIDSRVYLEDNLISKTFNSIITNSLLFIDVLVFKKYLQQKTEIRAYAQNLEYKTIHITYHALNSKEKERNDERLAQLFGASLTFIDTTSQRFDGSYREKLMHNHSVWENHYFLDIACLSVWEDNSLDYRESEFIFGIGKDLGFEKKQISESLEEVTAFFDMNAENIPFLKDNNMAMQFYESMSKVVNRLILRNSKRLQKELSESAELVALLSKSTVRDLNAEEKKKIQNQLIDIFKSIPSLAIFILPGGAVLLPIFIKLIPKLLPSSFDENRIEKTDN
ncbi:LETM1-related biofilm-associated protein [Maribacter sp. 2307UL18-2]|uniref:LETM1-related biofilm-associated protein n=1 Tax=Maribacter sp. 2307UL18-2 TaxID=3386274 RepID=UPI0039BD433E